MLRSRRLDLLVAAVVVLLGVPLALLGVVGVVTAWREDQELRLWQLVLVAVIAVGVVRAVQKVRGPQA